MTIANDIEAKIANSLRTETVRNHAHLVRAEGLASIMLAVRKMIFG